VSGAVRWLHSKSAMGPAMVVGQVVVESALGMFLVFDDDVVETVPAEGADHALGEGIGRRRARRSGEESGAESADAALEVGAVDRVSVVDKESGDLLSIAGCLRCALGGPAGAWVLGDAGVDDRASAEGENDEDVEEVEFPSDEDEEVAGPGLVQVVADEGSPALATLSVEVGRAVLGDGARGDLVAELGQFGGDDLLTPGGVLAPHPPDEFAEICINGGTARWTVGAPALEEAPGGTVPADDGLGFHEQHDVHEAVEAAGQGTDEPAIESAQARAFDLAADDDELLAKEQVLGDQGCAGRDEGQDEVEQEAKEADHGSDRVPRWSVPGTAGVGAWQGGPCGEGADLAPLWPRHRRRNRSRSSSLRSICAPQVLGQ
jgi:hypothetical protein